MVSPVSPVVLEEPGRYIGWRQTAGRLLRGGMETGILILVCLSPWALGAGKPVFTFLLYAGLAALLALWGGRMLLEWQFSWKKCPLAVCLAALFLSGIWQ